MNPIAVQAAQDLWNPVAPSLPLKDFWNIGDTYIYTHN